MKIRILALIMAVMMIVPLLFACAKPNDPIDGSDSGSNQTQNPTPEESTAAPSSGATNSSETGEQDDHYQDGNDRSRREELPELLPHHVGYVAHAPFTALTNTSSRVSTPNLSLSS